MRHSASSSIIHTSPGRLARGRPFSWPMVVKGGAPARSGGSPMRALALAFLASVSLVTAAHAGGVPITLQVGETVPDATFTLLGPSDFQDLKLNAAPATDYFLGIGVSG